MTFLVINIFFYLNDMPISKHRYLPFLQIKYEGHLESSLHGIITH